MKISRRYYSFGSPMPGRVFSSPSYRYGFNGKEDDDEVKGEGNTVAFELRIYDSRLGRFTTIDPRTDEYAWQTPYAYHKNSPIFELDYLGGGGPKDGVGKALERKKTSAHAGKKFGSGKSNTNSGNSTATATTTSAPPEQKPKTNDEFPYLSKESLEKIKGASEIVSNPPTDLLLGATEYQIGLALSSQGKYAFTRAPYEAIKVANSTTVINTGFFNISAPTKFIKVAAPALKIGGGVFGAIGMIGTYAEWKANKIEGQEAISDGIGGALGFIGPYGWLASVGYNVVYKPANSTLKTYNKKHPIEEPGNLIYHLPH